jgi:hypothetical protein
MSTTLLLGSLLALAGAAQTAMPPSSDKEVPQTVSEDERLVRDADITPDAAGLLAFFRKRTLTEDDRRGMARLVAQLGARSFVRREEASRRLQEWGPPALSFLTPAARLGTDLEVVRRAERIIDFISQGPGPNLPRAGARLLVRLRPPEAVGVLLDYLPYADDDTVQEEVLDALAALGSQ